MCFFFSEMDHHTALKLVPLWSSYLKTSVWYSKYKRKWCFSPKCVFSEMDHHTALKLVPLWSSHLKTSGCTEFGPLNTKESDVLSQMVFFSEMDHHTALKVVPLWSSDLKTSECTEFGPLNTKKSDVLSQKLYFYFRNGSSYRFKTCAIVIITPENLRVHWVWPSNYKGKWCFSPKSVFSEVDDHTALKCVPLWTSYLKTSECTVFGHLNKKESDVLAQNVFSQKQIIIQLWNLYHCDHHTWKPQSALSLVLYIQRKVIC